MKLSLNLLEYAFLAVVFVPTILLVLPMTAAKTVEILKANLLLMYGLAAVAFARWQWSLWGESETIVENPTADDQVAYYKTQRDVYLHFSLLVSILFLTWVVWLKDEVLRMRASTSAKED
mmetsp:Transcript_61037/g.145435  ORF Transcript_61037/g.145435 Transcript_61037/m.145435 type:complete len:120 (+) Transcript_61037:76-435(+)